MFLSFIFQAVETSRWSKESESLENKLSTTSPETSKPSTEYPPKQKNNLSGTRRDFTSKAQCECENETVTTKIMTMTVLFGVEKNSLVVRAWGSEIFACSQLFQFHAGCPHPT